MLSCFDNSLQGFMVLGCTISLFFDHAILHDLNGNASDAMLLILTKDNGVYNPGKN